MRIRFISALVLTVAALAADARGQVAQPQPGDSGTVTGTIPGAQGSNQGIIGGRAGGMRLRIPARPGARTPRHLEGLPPPTMRGAAPSLGNFALDVPMGAEDEGPPDGLTLDQAIDALARGSLTLRGRYLDIPQARADELTASLRANPFLYGDGQLIPYRRYSATSNPGGPTQYDLNVTYPLDLSGKRSARMQVACQARRVVEAQYQDAVRVELDNVYTAYVDVLAARETLRLARASLQAVDQVLRAHGEQRPNPTEEERLQTDHVEIHRNAIEVGLMDAEANLTSAKRSLAALLNLPREMAPTIELRGTLRDTAPVPPPAEELVTTALASRPDLAAFRLGLCRAMADVRLAQANRYADVYVLYQPFTYQDNSPFNLPSSRSWALGTTMTVPIYDRNQGNIRRAKYNVDQTRIEVDVIERRVAGEVEEARQEFAVSKAMVERMEQHLLPAARHVRDHTLKFSTRPGEDIYGYLIAQRDYQELVRQYRDALIRHRRSMLRLNTVVGMRVMP
ncbi:MAG: TolC family protein [Planctomycetia bacterium]|nr:TolC family protein [Planctomycetia bacterium]